MPTVFSKIPFGTDIWLASACSDGLVNVLEGESVLYKSAVVAKCRWNPIWITKKSVKAEFPSNLELISSEMAVRETFGDQIEHSGLIGVFLSLAGRIRGSARRGFVAAVQPEAELD